jgi:hypothetical protein
MCLVSSSTFGEGGVVQSNVERSSIDGSRLTDRGSARLRSGIVGLMRHAASFVCTCMHARLKARDYLRQSKRSVRNWTGGGASETQRPRMPTAEPQDDRTLGVIFSSRSPPPFFSLPLLPLLPLLSPLFISRAVLRWEKRNENGPINNRGRPQR